MLQTEAEQVVQQLKITIHQLGSHLIKFHCQRGKSFRGKETSQETPHERAFLKLAKEVEERVIHDTSSLTSLSDICSFYRGYLHDEGVAVESYRADKLKVRLLKHFRSQLCLHRPQKRNESHYVFSSAVPPGLLVERCLQLQQAAAERSSSDEDTSMIDIVDEVVTTNREDASEASTIFAAVMILRSKLLSLKNQMPLPPHPSEIKHY